MQVGCYSLDLYCDVDEPEHKWRGFPHQVIGERGSTCRAEARKRGWILGRDGKDICPMCAAKMRRRGKEQG